MTDSRKLQKSRYEQEETLNFFIPTKRKINYDCRVDDKVEIISPCAINLSFYGKLSD